jgi:hypothetical protein
VIERVDLAAREPTADRRAREPAFSIKPIYSKPIIRYQVPYIASQFA